MAQHDRHELRLNASLRPDAAAPEHLGFRISGLHPAAIGRAPDLHPDVRFGDAPWVSMPAK